jgi:hypothetical protein
MMDLEFLLLSEIARRSIRFSWVFRFIFWRCSTCLYFFSRKEGTSLCFWYGGEIRMASQQARGVKEASKPASDQS